MIMSLAASNSAAGDQGGRERERKARLGITGEHEKKRGEHRRCIGGSAEHADIAVLDAHIPGIEGSAHGSYAEPGHRQPFAVIAGPGRFLEEEVKD